MATDQSNEKFSETFKIAVDVFKDIDQALSWINAPCPELGDQIPIQLLEKTGGVELVLEALERISQKQNKR
jgi:putative toxin-antitoxin system antitoxin component (TIGR02293 family)